MLIRLVSNSWRLPEKKAALGNIHVVICVLSFHGLYGYVVVRIVGGTKRANLDSTLQREKVVRGARTSKLLIISLCNKFSLHMIIPAEYYLC